MGIKLPKGAVARERELSLIERVERIERELGLTSTDNETTNRESNETSDESDTGHGSEDVDKDALIARALELKSEYPKYLKAPPSAIPAMSVEKLTALIAEAEAIITAGGQE